ncbi:hypothetical protein DWX23_15030 [Parabacteroides sp. AF18-52]|jgi:hypothetical protein|nr:hypothetical protein DWX23_15030 [Parabacteroides sp. AF18-52]
MILVSDFLDKERMKKILNLISISMAAIFLNACSVEQSVDGGDGLRGLMAVEVLTDGALADDHIHTARFIVFDDASVFPSVDINKMMTLENDDRDAKEFRTTLKVHCNPDKMLVVILNEPATLTGFLETVTAPGDLETVTYLMAEIFNENHTATLTKGIPMTAASYNISVTEENDTESKAARVEMEVKRAVARVELWLRTELPFQSEVGRSTAVTLLKSHDEGCLMAPDATRNFGYMQTVDAPDKEVSWSYTDTDPLKLADTLQFVCAFYTPERTCSAPGDADKLILDIRGIGTSDGTRNAVSTLSSFSTGGGPSQYITEIRRNNVYRISGVVRKQMVEFEQKVVPWTEVGQGVIIDPQYFLTVTRDNLYLPDDGNKTSITATTNYDRIDDDRGFPSGICLGETKYYDKTGQPEEDTQSSLYGWLSVTLGGVAGELVQEIEFSVSGTLNENEKGCYATAEVKAGNLIKLIKVKR